MYMAPELVLGKEYSAEVDIWAVGVISHILLTGKPPFGGSTKDRIFLNIVKKEPSIDESLPPLVKSMIEACLNKTANMRPSAQKLLQSEFFD